MVNESKKFHYVYQIKNEINGKIYIGKHSTNNIDDNYMGSGTRITRAIKKYGIENFTKTIIDVCLTEEQAFELESFIVDKEFIERSDSYNLRCGGVGSSQLSDETRRKRSESHKGRVYVNNGIVNKIIKLEFLEQYISEGWNRGKFISDETRIKRRKSQKDRVCINNGAICKFVKPEHLEQYLKDGWLRGVTDELKRKNSESQKGKVPSDETRKKISNHHRGKSRDAETRKKISDYHKGRKKSDETKKKISEARKGRISINKENVNKKIKPELLEEYLKKGWEKGGIKHTTETKKKLSEARNRVFINNGIINTTVNKELLEQYISEGWIKGRK